MNHWMSRVKKIFSISSGNHLLNQKIVEKAHLNKKNIKLFILTIMYDKLAYLSEIFFNYLFYNITYNFCLNDYFFVLFKKRKYKTIILLY